MRIRKALCAVALALAAFAPQASAETIEVTPETFKQALANTRPGDTLLLENGIYQGGTSVTRSGREGAPITIAAKGHGCVFEGGLDALNLEGASWIVIEDIRFQNAERVGLRIVAPADSPASNVTVRNCVFADNIWPGVMTGHIDTLTIESCEAFGSIKSHGIYVGNSGDHPVIRNNRVHHNFGNGIHINGDPECGGDGVISHALVEGNLIWENGKRGGSAINMTHVQDSLIRNNVAWHNYGAGIALYYDTGGDTCASKRNKVLHNTVFFRPAEGKYALLMRKSATDCIVKNNVLVGGRYGAVYVEPSCYEGLAIDHNVICTYPAQTLLGDSSEDINISAADWQANGFDVNSKIAVMPEFISLEGGNLCLAPGSAGVDAGTPLGELVPTDISGMPRPQGDAFDCGAYEYRPPETLNADPANLKAVLARANPGDTVVLADGTYAGGVVFSRSGRAAQPITIKAAGESCVFEGGDFCFRITRASWVEVDWLRFRNATRYGVRVGDSHHIAFRRCVFADHTSTNFITGHVDYLTVEGCESYGSVKSHGIYVGNSGDCPLIRNNRVHHNHGNGIHINGDPECGGDGVISHALVEGNVIHDNGRRGGSAMSVMYVRDSIFRNNLLYNNYAAGFTLVFYHWPAAGPPEAQNSKRIQVVSNTVYFRPGEGGHCLLMRRDTTDCRIANNIFVGGAADAVLVEPSCFDGLVMDHNVIANHPGQALFGDPTEDKPERIAEFRQAGFEAAAGGGVKITVDQWRQKGFDENSALGTMPEFADVGACDFHLAPGSPGVDLGANLGDLVPTDIEGAHRPQGPAHDCGAYESAPVQEPKGEIR